MPSGLQGLSSGFAQGFSLMGNYLGQQEDRKFRQEQAKRADEWRERSFGLQQAQFQAGREDRKDDLKHRDRTFEQSISNRAEDVAWREQQAARQAQQWQATFQNQQSQFAQTFGLQAARHNITAQTFAREQAQWSEEDRRREIQAAAVVEDAYRKGNASEQDVLDALKRAGLDPAQYNADGGAIPAAVDVATQALQAGDFSSPDLVPAFNVLFANELQQGVGETYTDDSGTWTIENKIATHLVPGPDGQSAAVNLKVFETNEKGETREREAPMTAGHSAKDDEVAFVPADVLIEKVQGHSALVKGLNADGRLKAMLDAELTRLGGTPTDRGKYTDPERHDELGWIQRGTDGKVSPIEAGHGAPRMGASKDAPAQVQTVEWLAEKLTGGDYQAAWEMAQRSKSNPQEMAGKLYMARKKEARDAYEDITDEEIMEEVEAAMRMLAQLPDAQPARQGPGLATVGGSFSQAAKGGADSSPRQQAQRPAPSGMLNSSGGQSSPVEQAIRKHPDPATQQQAMSVLQEAMDAINQRPNQAQAIERMLADELRKMGVSL